MYSVRNVIHRFALDVRNNRARVAAMELIKEHPLPRPHPAPQEYLPDSLAMTLTRLDTYCGREAGFRLNKIFVGPDETFVARLCAHHKRIIKHNVTRTYM